ncbi:MAG: hypothetical protein AB4206_21615 [Xenococcaceae cyanobacterium]
MLFSKSFSRVFLVTTTSVISTLFVANLPAKAATFSVSETVFTLDNFSTSPQNPSVESIANTVAVSRDEIDIAEANAEGTVTFEADSDFAFLNADFSSDAFGGGSNFFSFGESSSFAVGTFALDAEQILSFDFALSLVNFNDIDSLLDGGVSTLSGVYFSLFDNITDDVLGDFIAVSNVETNLAEGRNNDFTFVDGSSNVEFEGFSDENFEGNSEFSALFLTGSYLQFFDSPTEVRLEVGTLNRSCVQASPTTDPCPRVPEPSNTLALLFGFLGLGLVSRLVKSESNSSY